MFAQVGVGALQKLAGGALLCEVSTLVRSPSDGGERLPLQVVPGRGQVGAWGLRWGKASRLDVTSSGGGAELWGG